MTDRFQVAVIGAGAFGGWTAYNLLRNYHSVILADAWGPGNSRASSGGETRLIRATYGPAAVYTKMAVRALELWKEAEARWTRKFYHKTGLVWMITSDDDAYERAALPVLAEAGVAYERLSPEDAALRFPQIDFSSVRWVIYERDVGYLTARSSCQIVAEQFASEGGTYLQAQVKPGPIENGRMLWAESSGGTRIEAEQFVFACGPWLGAVFPGVIGSKVRPTRQEIFFFGTPAGTSAYDEGTMPAWVDRGEKFFYGMPGNQFRGFKIADDERGETFDPTAGDRTPSAEGLSAVRAFIARRFPGLKGAPLLDARVCQYEQSSDQDFIIDRHPEAENVWIVGGGSGHGFKHGPAVGEHVAAVVRGESELNPAFRLSRFSD